MDVVYQALGPGLLLIVLLTAVRIFVSRVHFASENILDIRAPDGRQVVLNLNSLGSTPAAQRQEQIEKAIVELA
jgi:hypothetical protein